MQRTVARLLKVNHGGEHGAIRQSSAASAPQASPGVRSNRSSAQSA